MLCQRDFQKCGLDYGRLQDRLANYFMSHGNLNMAAAYTIGAVKIKTEAVGDQDVEVQKSKLILAGITGEIGNLG